jgi:hypothetical protein
MNIYLFSFGHCFVCPLIYGFHIYQRSLSIFRHRLRHETEVAYARVNKLNANFNNISVISWRSVLLVEETREKFY